MNWPTCKLTAVTLYTFPPHTKINSKQVNLNFISHYLYKHDLFHETMRTPAIEYPTPISLHIRSGSYCKYIFFKIFTHVPMGTDVKKKRNLIWIREPHTISFVRSVEPFHRSIDGIMTDWYSNISYLLVQHSIWIYM